MARFSGTAKPSFTAVVLIVASLSLAACGVRGSLQSPPDAEKKQAGSPENKPHSGFILDRLLR